MAREKITIEITEHDIEDFKSVVYAKDDSEDFDWTYMTEEGVCIDIHFTRGGKEDEEDSD